MSVCTTVDRLIADFEKRAEHGLVKYSITVGNEELSLLQWMQHTRHELMDACIYLTKMIETFETRTEAASVVEGKTFMNE